jgi:hypothetical protein
MFQMSGGARVCVYTGSWGADGLETSWNGSWQVNGAEGDFSEPHVCGDHNRFHPSDWPAPG